MDAKATSVPATGARCAQHPETPASGLCDRCGAFVCFECELPWENRSYCPPCSHRVKGLFGGSWFSIFAAIAAFLSLGCGALGLVAIVLAAVDLARIAAGHGQRGGLKLDLIAIGLGVIGLAIGAAIVLRLASGEAPSFDP